MDIHEIQIDDYVMFDGFVYQIEEISKKGWVHLTQDGNRVSLSSDYILSCLEGVHLTKEILKSNGFYEERNVGYVYDDEGCEVVVDLWNNNIRVLYNRDIIINLYEAFNLHVHKLQQVLRLAGIEKEILI